MPRWRRAAVCAAWWTGLSVGSPFATRVLEYRPAPGQFVTLPSGEGILYNQAIRALGPPDGGGTLVAGNGKALTLGGFGGSITLGFDARIMDRACNPMGLDAIVFGNAVWVSGNPARRWAEAGVIEISRDDNGNGLADDAWYLIPGAGLGPAAQSVWRAQMWDNNPGTATPPANTTWYPGPPVFVGWPSAYSTTGYELPAEYAALVLENPPTAAPGEESRWGYADLSPVLLRGDMSGANGDPLHDNLLTDPEDEPGISPERFYTWPDDPSLPGVSEGSCGGDAFDIAWAVNPLTGAPAGIDGFDFIRITTGVHAVLGVFGERSTEVSGVSAVRSVFEVEGDANRDGRVDFLDLNLVLGSFGQAGCCVQGDVNCDGRVDFLDLNLVLGAFGAGA